MKPITVPSHPHSFATRRAPSTPGRRQFLGSLGLLAAGGWLWPARGFAQQAEGEPAAENILDMVRMSHALQQHQLAGSLRVGNRRERFTLSMEGNMIRFRFDNPLHVIHLDLDTADFRLREVIDGNNRVIATNRHGQAVRQSDVNFEDLSLRFLYWSDPELIDTETINTRRCWKVRVYSPDRDGPYHAVEIWVDQQSGGMMRLQGYDYDGKMIKRFEVRSGQRVGDAWILRQMRVETFEPGSGRASSRTYLEIDPPS